jgi:hypothetical protein
MREVLEKRGLKEDIKINLHMIKLHLETSIRAIICG